MTDTLSRLETTIAARLATGDPAKSYIAGLAAAGTGAMAQKLGEEAVEAIVAAMANDRPGLTSEAADLIFHLLVLLRSGGVTLADVCAELDRREGTSGIAEKAARKR